MFLLFPCPGTIPVPSCRPSCQMSCWAPPLSGCVAVAVSRLSTTPMTAPMLFCGSFTIRVRLLDEIISVSCLKACMEVDATPGSPWRSGRPLSKRPGGPAATKQVSFADPLVSPPLLRHHHKTVSKPFSYLARRFLRAGTSGAFTASTDTVPVPSTGTATEVRPLTSSPSSWGQSSGGALWRAVYTPGWWSNQSGVLHYPCTVPVYKLLCIQ